MWKEIKEEHLSGEMREQLESLARETSKFKYGRKAACISLKNPTSTKPTIEVSFTCSSHVNAAPLFALKRGEWALGKVHQEDAVVSVEVNRALVTCAGLPDVIRILYEKLGYVIT